MKLKDVLSPLRVWERAAKKPMTIKDPINDRPGATNYRGFHKNDFSKCIGCGTCEEICQNAAIDLVPVEGQETVEGDSGLRPMIDYGRCCWCALCVDVCPTGALTMSNDYTWIADNPEDYRFVPGADKTKWQESEKGYTRSPDIQIIDYDRVDMQELEPEERDKSFIEIVKGYNKEQAIKEAERCLECGLCIATCPAHMDIPGYIAAIRDDDIDNALRILYETNPMPEICGRICTHKCETACALHNNGDPLAIRWLKRYIVDQVPADKYSEILGTDHLEDEVLNRKVAIIGAGPAGLSAAYYLAIMGYKTKVYEALPGPGGMARYGIPEYRLPYDQIDKDINYIRSLGVEIQFNTRVGTDITLEELHSSYDAVFAGTGLHLGRSTRVPGADNKRVYFATDLLREVTLGNEIDVAKNIVVIGGGNVAMDITRTLARLQNQKYGKVQILTTCLETEDIMPADVEEIVEAREEKAVIDPGWGPKEIEIRDGKVYGLHVVKCLSVFDENGRFSPKFDEDQKKFFKADMVVESIGQGMDLSYLSEGIKSDLKFSPRGRIEVDDSFQSSLQWLFVGGDIIQGPDVIHGIANGYIAAKGIDTYLNAE
ncbi:MAG: FAD-dependent oxidoreductase [Candidatus Fermentibacteraceae bacterium]|nr:FAD-dependent oxidoreductase [Candidatus Fermentibacteraceae bacterium]